MNNDGEEINCGDYATSSELEKAFNDMALQTIDFAYMFYYIWLLPLLSYYMISNSRHWDRMHEIILCASNNNIQTILIKDEYYSDVFIQTYNIVLNDISI